jgi:4-diphosphocytidyl-2-C-methyl-D-erythritol kinase
MIGIDAPAKLTLSLHITGLRDDGFHLIDAEMVTLDLADQLTIIEGEQGITVDGPYADGITVDDDNLVARALSLAKKRARVHITKNIPHGGGLGGGSADAAAILRWAGYDDFAAASRLGADIPFCMVGGRARVTGIGEIVSPLAPIERTMTLVIPPFGVSTPKVYASWDTLDSALQKAPVNDLEAAAIAAEPRLGQWRQRIEACGVSPVLAGSGSTWWIDGSHPDLAEQLPDATVIVASTRYLRR